MHTATSKQIMGPVAEAISELMALNLEAETKNAALPNLTELATVVDEQAKNLVNVGKSMVESGGDDQLKQDMPLACDHILEASTLLLAASFDLVADPKSKAGRDKLLQGCCGLLEGTFKILDVYDECEIRRIVQNCDICISNLQTLKQIFDIQSLIQHIKPTCQQLVDVTHIVKLRVDEILYATLQDRLREDIDSINMTSNLLVSSSKAVAQNYKNEAAVNARELCCDNIISSLRDIQTVVQIREYKESDIGNELNNLLNTRNDVFASLVAIMNNAQAQDETQLQNSLEMFNFASELLLNNASEIAAKYGTTTGKKLQAQIQEIKKSSVDIQTLSLQVSKNPQDGNVSDLHKLLSTAETSFRNLNSLTDQVLANQVNGFIMNSKNHNDAETTLFTLVSASKSGDVQIFKQVSANMTQDIAMFQQSLGQLEMRLQDPETLKVLRQIEKAIEGNAKFLQASAAAVNAAPSDKSALENLDGSVAAWEDQTAKVEAFIRKFGVLKVSDQVLSDVAQLKESLDTYEKEPEPRVSMKARESAANILTSVKRAMNVARYEGEKTDDLKLKHEYASITSVLEKDLTTMNQQYSNMNDPKQQKAFISSGRNAYEKLAKLSSIVEENEIVHNYTSMIPSPILKSQPEIVQNDQDFATTADGEEVQIVDEAPLEALPEEEAKANPIKAAAHDLTLVTSQFSKKENAMIDKSSSLAEKMAMLSSLYKENSPQAKKSMIEVSKQIFLESSKFVEEAKKIHDSCTDKSLKNQLRVAMESIGTLSVQLKIITAVKVAESKDLDSEKQLILCCQNLMNAVKVTLKASEIASLRAFKAAGTAALGMVKFRKILYKKRGLKSP